MRVTLSKVTPLHRTRLSMLLTCGLCLMLWVQALAVTSFPPLLPEGEPWSDIATLLDNMPTQPHVRALTFSPDGRTLLAVDAGGTVRWWDVVSGHTVRQLFVDTFARSVSLSRDGRLLAIGSSEGRVHLWDIAAGQEKQPFQGGQFEVQAVSISPDNRLLVAEAGGLEQIVLVWDMVTGRELYRLTGHRSTPYGLSFSPDSRTLATGDQDGSVRLWDMASGHALRRLTAPYSVQALHFSPDGRLLAAGGGDGVVVWEAATGRERQQLKGHSDGVQAIHFSPDGHLLAVAARDQSRTVRLWEVTSGTEVLRLAGTPETAPFPHYTSEKETLDFSPDGHTLAAWAGDGTVRLWDLASGQERRRLGGHWTTLRAVQVSPDGQTIASGGEDGTVRLWDATSGQERVRLAGFWGPVHTLGFRPDGRTLAAGTADGTVWLWDLASGQTVARLKGHTGAVQAVNFSPDGQLLASISEGDEVVRVWEVASGQEVRTLAEPGTRVRAMRFSLDGVLLATGDSAGTVRLWELISGQVLREFKIIADNSVQALRFHPDGQLLAVSSEYENTVWLWDLAAGRERQRFTAHSGVQVVHFTPDGSTLLAVTRDGTVQVWDAVSGEERQRREAYLGWVNAVSFSPDGRTLVTGAGYGTVQVVAGEDWTFSWLALGGRGGNWLTYHANGQGWRYDDGSFLLRQDGQGTLRPMVPSQPAAPGHLELLVAPAALTVEDGSATAFHLTVHNSGAGRVYWVNVVQEASRTPETSLILHPPPPTVVVEPGATVDIPCKVSAPVQHTQPPGREAVLHVHLTTAHAAPLALAIPVTVRAPSLQWLGARQSEEKRTWHVTLQQGGMQDLPTTEFRATIADTTVDKVVTPLIRSGETVQLAFVLPTALRARDVQVTLTAVSLTHPVHIWQFPAQSLTLPTLPWLLYALGAGLCVVGSTVGVYGLYRWRHRRRRAP